jgi:hypothetical protein
MQIAETASLAPVNDAVDFLIAISETARSFDEQDSAKRRDPAAGCTGKSRLERGRVADVVQNAVRGNCTFEPRKAR